MKTIKIALVMALILQMTNYTFAYENEPTEASQSLVEVYEEELSEEEYTVPECDGYCEAESWVIDNLIPQEIWEDENGTNYINLWEMIAILTEAKINGELVYE